MSLPGWTDLSEMRERWNQAEATADSWAARAAEAEVRLLRAEADLEAARNAAEKIRSTASRIIVEYEQDTVAEWWEDDLDFHYGRRHAAREVLKALGAVSDGTPGKDTR